MKRRLLAVAVFLVSCGCSAPESQLHVGNLAFRRGQFEQAQESFEKAMQSPEHVAVASFNLGRIHYEKQNFEKAAELFRQALTIEAQYPLVRVYLGRALLGLHQNEEAESELKRAATISPADSQSSYYLAQALAAQGKLEQAVETIQRCKNDSSLVEPASLLSSQWLEQMGELDQAIQELRALLPKHEFNTQIHLRLGGLLQKTARYEEAASVYRKALKLNPGLTEAQSGLAESQDSFESESSRNSK